MKPINFKIVGVDRVRGQILTHFYSDDWPEGVTHAIDLPIQDGVIVSLAGQQLIDFLMGFCPVAEFQRRHAMQHTPPDLAHIEAMLQPLPQAPREVTVDEVRIAPAVTVL